MGTNELAIRFTENKYATKNEVAKELRTSLVDTFWHNILAYRSNFNHYLTIKSIDKNMFVFCGCQTINATLSSIEAKFNKIQNEYSRIASNKDDFKYITDQWMVKSLKAVAAKNDLEVTEAYLRSLISGDLREVAVSHQVLVKYLNACKYASVKYTDLIDDNYLAGLFQKFHNIDDIIVFYRNKEDSNRENRVLIDRIYTCAPVQLIDRMMGSLFSFVSTCSLSVIAKALISYYYMSYVRPFEVASDEFSILFAKSILAHDAFGDCAIYMPIESLLRNTEDVGKLFADVQKTNDVTYFVNYMMKILDKLCDETLNDLAQASVKIIRNDYYQEDRETMTTVTYSEDIPEKKPEPVIEQKPVVEEVKVEPVPSKEEPIKEQVKVQEKVQDEQKIEKVEVKYVAQQLAVSYIPPALDEKEAYRLEQHLREMDPSLKKMEAKFYARHCVIGKKYTISQYKKYAGCVYETARTSMEHLAQLGYYRKEQVKNKFVYSPIQR